MTFDDCTRVARHVCDFVRACFLLEGAADAIGSCIENVPSQRRSGQFHSLVTGTLAEVLAGPLKIDILFSTIGGRKNLATPKLLLDEMDLSKEQLDLIQQFEADYNAVDHSLREALGSDKHVRFIELVNEYSREHSGWRDADLLRTIAKLRNSIVHGKTEPYRYVAIPTPGIAEQLGRCRERLMNPLRAIPKFERTVETISIRDTLQRVLNIIHERDYCQFPVYDDNEFRGVLTENGITRWLAGHVVKSPSMLELDDIFVGDVLWNEEERVNHLFVLHTMLVDDVSALFAKEAWLEAALITTNGNETEKLLGIATRWDILNLER